jgi:hypothetical protein
MPSNIATHQLADFHKKIIISSHQTESPMIILDPKTSIMAIFKPVRSLSYLSGGQTYSIDSLVSMVRGGIKDTLYDHEVLLNRCRHESIVFSYFFSTNQSIPSLSKFQASSLTTTYMACEYHSDSWIWMMICNVGGTNLPNPIPMRIFHSKSIKSYP